MPNEYVRELSQTTPHPRIRRLPLRPHKSELSYLATLNSKWAEKYEQDCHAWFGSYVTHYLELSTLLPGTTMGYVGRAVTELGLTSQPRDLGVSNLFLSRTR